MGRHGHVVRARCDAEAFSFFSLLLLRPFYLVFFIFFYVFFLFFFS